MEKKHPPLSITKEEINELPLEQYAGPLTILESTEGLSSTLARLGKEPILGFDTESKPTFQKSAKKNPISLVQLASTKEVVLFRINKIGFHPELVELLSNDKILKVGVAIRDDLIELKKFGHFVPENFLDVSKIADELNIKNRGLRSLAALLFKIRISKSAKLSNWNQENLSDSQIAYAATDAWMSLKIYESLIVLKSGRQKMEEIE